MVVDLENFKYVSDILISESTATFLFIVVALDDKAYRNEDSEIFESIRI